MAKNISRHLENANWRNNMKLFRHGATGAERAGAIDAQGVMRDPSLLLPDFTPERLRH